MNTANYTRAIRKVAKKYGMCIKRTGLKDHVAVYQFWFEDEEFPEIFSIELQLDLNAYHQKYLGRLCETARYHLEKINAKNKKKIKRHIGSQYVLDVGEDVERQIENETEPVEGGES